MSHKQSRRLTLRFRKRHFSIFPKPLSACGDAQAGTIPSFQYSNPAKDGIFDFPIGAKPLSYRSGFTLMEILIAIFILGLIMATVLGTFTSIISSSRDAEKKAELYQTGRAVMDLISTDIRCMFNMTLDEKAPYFSGTLETIDGKSMSSMGLVTTNSLTIGAEKNPFLSEVSYRIKKNQREDTYSLWRRSQSPPDYLLDEGGREVPVCRIMERFKLEFIYNNDKKENLVDLMPEAIIINFTLNLEGERENFVTMVRPMVTVGG